MVEVRSSVESTTNLQTVSSSDFSSVRQFTAYSYRTHILAGSFLLMQPILICIFSGIHSHMVECGSFLHIHIERTFLAGSFLLMQPGLILFLFWVTQP